MFTKLSTNAVNIEIICNSCGAIVEISKPIVLYKNWQPGIDIAYVTIEHKCDDVEIV
jgi:hypothetical protein